MLKAAIIFSLFGLVAIICGLYRAYGFDLENGKIILLLSEMAALVCFMGYFAKNGFHFHKHSSRRD